MHDGLDGRLGEVRVRSRSRAAGSTRAVRGRGRTPYASMRVSSHPVPKFHIVLIDATAMSAQRSATPRAARSTKAVGRPSASRSVLACRRLRGTPPAGRSVVPGAGLRPRSCRAPRRRRSAGACSIPRGTRPQAVHRGAAKADADRSRTAVSALRRPSEGRRHCSHRSQTVTSHSCASSWPCSSTSGTEIQVRAHLMRSASSRMFASSSSGPHLMYRPSSVRKVSPPIPLSQTGVSAAPRASSRTRPGRRRRWRGCSSVHPARPR